MRFKESMALDRMIDERRVSLSRSDLDQFEMEKRAMALTALIMARNELDRIAAIQAPEYVRKHIKFSGTAEDGRRIKSRKRRDLRHLHLQAVPAVTNIGDIHVTVKSDTEVSGRSIARQLRKEFRKGNSSL